MKLHKLSPILWTKDLQATIAFYESVLGFKGTSGFPNFVSLSREDVEIMFVVPQDEPNDCEPFFFKPIVTGSLYIITEPVDELWESVKDKATIKTQLDDREYYMRDFSILDNNGYELAFGQHIPCDK